MTTSSLAATLSLAVVACGSTGTAPATTEVDLTLVRVAEPRIEAEARLCGRSDHFLGVPDGDTLDVVLTRIVDEAAHGEAKCAACRAAQARDRDVHGHTQLRLGGGIDAPEADAIGGRETREVLLALLGSGRALYLDIDDGARGCPQHAHSGRDVHCRLLAKVYVRAGETYVDVNATLVAWGQQHYPRHDWLRYASKPTEFTDGAASDTCPQPADDPIVWVTRSGKRYHREDCNGLARSKFPLTRSAALARGFTPCRSCDPS